jgi:large subunit ribosomal protein L18
MTRNSRYHVPFRRRREAKTDYYQRRELIKSKKPRLIIRCTLSHTIAQFANATQKGDDITVSACSKELLRDYGWKAPCGNVPAAYLTGLLAGFKAKKRGLSEAILDIGLTKKSVGSRLFAALKGVLDSGVVVPGDKKMLPNESRINGEHIAKYASKISSDTELYQKLFSQYLKNSLKPEEITVHFENVKKNIENAFLGAR